MRPQWVEPQVAGVAYTNEFAQRVQARCQQLLAGVDLGFETDEEGWTELHRFSLHAVVRDSAPPTHQRDSIYLPGVITKVRSPIPGVPLVELILMAHLSASVPTPYPTEALHYLLLFGSHLRRFWRMPPAQVEAEVAVFVLERLDGPNVWHIIDRLNRSDGASRIERAGEWTRFHDETLTSLLRLCLPKECCQLGSARTWYQDTFIHRPTFFRGPYPGNDVRIMVCYAQQRVVDCLPDERNQGPHRHHSSSLQWLWAGAQFEQELTRLWSLLPADRLDAELAIYVLSESPP